MKARALIALVAVAVVLAGCRKDPDPYPEPGPPDVGTLRVTLVPIWADSAFDSHSDYHDVLDHRLQVQLLKFYLASITALGPGGDEPLSEIELFDAIDGMRTREWALP